MATQEKVIRRALPYFDPRKLCGWLEEMAREGYHLKDNGIHFGIATFDQGDPAKVHYLADPINKEKALFSKEWKYKATWRKFSFYASHVSRPGPLHEHPDISRQAWRKFGNPIIWSSLLFIPLFLLNLYILFVRENAILFLPNLFLILTGALLLLAFWALCHNLRYISLCGKMRKKLIDSPEDFSLPPKKSGSGHRVPLPALRNFLLVFIMIPWFLSLVYTDVEMTSSELPQTPLINMEEYHGDWIMVPDEMETYRYNEYSNYLFPRSVYWTEYGELYHKEEITSADSGDYAAIYVSYHETAVPFIARALANRYLRSDLLHRDKYKVESSDLPVDQIWIFSDQDPYFLLQDGRIVVRIRMETNKEDPFTQEELLQWAKCLAESIDGKG